MNVITIELCAEDRARLDRLAEALERKACDSCVASALTWAEQMKACQEAAKQSDLDPIQQKLADALANASGPADAPVASPQAPIVAEASPNTHPVTADLPGGDPTTAPAPPSLEEFQKALTLRCAESDATKAKVRALLNEYAAAASKVPPEKRAEVLERLAKL